MPIVPHTKHAEHSRLSRRLGTFDAVTLGLASMIGAGIFAAVGPAADAAGSGILIGLVLAGCLAFLNATSVAELAAIYPESGGAYVYGRKRLGRFWGFLAGWGFVIGKIASCSAMALTFASYAAPNHMRPLAVGAALTMTAINYFGVEKTALAAKALVGLVLVSLALVVFAATVGGGADVSRLSEFFSRGGITGILQAAGMMFFAFAGYARIATLGEEVIDPKSTIPRAIIISLVATLGVYLVVIASVVLCVDVDDLAESKMPLALAIQSGSFSYLSPAVRVGASLASLGVLLSLLAGVSRTAFSMSANADLPRFLNAVHPRRKVPDRAEILIGAIIATVVAFSDIRSAIGFSSFAILIYYAIANASAWSLLPTERLWPRWMAAFGFVTCIIIALSLPIKSIVGGLLLFALGAGGYALFVRSRN